MKMNTSKTVKVRSTFSGVLLSLVLLFCSAGLSRAQDSSKVKPRKNVIRFNLTNPMFFGEKSLLVGYERVIGKHMSASINGGQASFPKADISVFDFDSTQIVLNKDYIDFGFTFALDYRFYLKKENKYNAPHGVYIGPYYSLTHFERENNWSMTSPLFTGNVKTNFNATIQMVGIEMGYQFILWKRVALDFILIGPGVTFYNIKTKINTQLDSDGTGELLNALKDALSNRVPGFSTLVEDMEFEKSGSTNTMSMGFRYVIHLGFNF
jgi:hypothetical protein